MQGNGTEFKRKAKLLAELAQYPTRSLTIHGEVQQALELTGVGRWTSLKHLRVCDVGSREPLNLELFARFSNLVTLDITLAGSFLVCDSDSIIYLPYLRRLVLEDDEWVTPGLWNCKRFFTPACMPNLTHLSLDVLGRNPPSAILVFNQLFPQLTCLALGNSNPDYDYAIVLQALSRLTKLKHLMLSVVGERLVSALFDKGAGLDLESLHLNGSLLLSDAMLRNGLETFVRAQGSLLLMDTNEQTLSYFPYLRRLVIYGKTEIENTESNPPIFSSVNTPNLTSLALGETDLDYEGFEHLFCRIFSQISTLAAQDFRNGLGLVSQVSRQTSQPPSSLDRSKPAHQASVAETEKAYTSSNYIYR
ncbi:hypothetical protein JCM5353_002141 [Sporobolomyces roseus]